MEMFPVACEVDRASMCISKIILFGLILKAKQNHTADRKGNMPKMVNRDALSYWSVCLSPKSGNYPALCELIPHMGLPY